MSERRELCQDIEVLLMCKSEGISNIVYSDVTLGLSGKVPCASNCKVHSEGISSLLILLIDSMGGPAKLTFPGKHC